jgi:hypothetical protein
MRSIVLLSAMMMGLCLGQPAAAVQSPHEASELDHVLLWGRSIDQASAVMAVKLGFQVRPGRDPDGVANRYVRMSDGSYVELEGITRPDAQMDPGMRADQAALHGGPGVRTFGLRSPALDRERVLLRQRGFAPTQIFSASPDDPDGGGPSAPPRWRLFAFERQPLSSHLFFIDYAAARLTPARAADDRTAREHPNSARELSAIWLLSSNAEADRKQFGAMGYAGATPIRLPQVAARGYCVPVGRKRVFVLQPDGVGIAADALRSGGPQVLGISVGVADIGRAKRQVERGYERPLAGYRGLLGNSFLAPTRDDLGLLVEFHALPDIASASPCG